MTEEQKPQELVLDEKKEEQPQEQKVEEQNEEKPQEQPQEQKPEEQPQEQKTEEQPQEQKTEEQPQEQKPEEQKEENPQEQPQEQNPEEQKEENPREQPQEQNPEEQQQEQPGEENQEQPEEQEPKQEEEQDGKELLEELKNQISSATKEEDLFAGPYERLIDRKFIPDPNYEDTKILPEENFNSEIVPKRKFFYKILITRPKREFEAPLNNLFQDKNSSEEQTVGNNEVKGVKSANEYPLSERSTIEMGFQTANATVPKSFQVAKKLKINNYTQTENNLSDIKDEFLKKVNSYLSNQNSLTSIDNFLQRIKPKMEEALQSN